MIAGTTHRYSANTRAIEELGTYLGAFPADDNELTVDPVSHSTQAKSTSTAMWQTVVGVNLTAPPADIYRYWTNKAYMRRWLFDDVDSNPTPGGIFRIRSDADEEIRGTFRHLAPGEFISFTWAFTVGAVPLPPGHNEVTIWLQPTNDGTHTVLELRQLAPDAARAELYDTIWSEMLGRLVDAIDST